MPFNLAGTLVPFYAILNPRLLLPSLSVVRRLFLFTSINQYYFFLQRDIRYLDFAALRDAGYRGAIFDKDNCLVPVFSHPLSVRTHTTFRLFQMMTSSSRS